MNKKMNTLIEKELQEIAEQRKSYYTEDLNELRGYTVAFDASLLLSKVTMSNPLKTLQEGHATLDIQVQEQLMKILDDFRKNYQIQSIVVIDGMRPVSLTDEVENLKKSLNVWSKVNSDRDEMYAQILTEFGSRFYQQEIINATKSVKDCQYWVAPGLSTPQACRLFQDSLVNVVFGSVKLLAYGRIKQAIVDFDLRKGTFSFVDKEDFKVKNDLIADYLVASGALYNKVFIDDQRLRSDLLTGREKFQTLIPNVDDQAQFIKLKSILTKSCPVITKDKSVTCISSRDSNFGLIGLRFSDEIYFYMSRGLLDSRMLEQIQNRNTNDEIVLTPSYFIKEAWEIPEFAHFMSIAMGNLLELKGDDKKEKASSEHLKSLIDFLTEKKVVEDAFKMQGLSLWNISDSNIRNEFDRADSERVSFYFVLRWLRHEVQKITNNKGVKTGPDHLLSVVAGNEKDPASLKSENELLASCYFQYLESNQFLSYKMNYLYGDLLEQGADFEESVLIMLEMLRIYFPAGQPLEVPQSHEPFAATFSKNSSQDNVSVTLLSRVFSLFTSSVVSPDVPSSFAQLDFDLAQFSTYAETLKQRMRFVFQTILFRLFRQGRCKIDIETYQGAVERLAFQRQEGSPLGQLIKSILMRESFEKPYAGGFQGSIFEEFKITKEDVKACLRESVRLWKKIRFIIEILENRESLGSGLKKEFHQAHQFFMKKLQQFGESETLEMLQQR